MGDSNPRRSVRCPHCAGPLTKEMETSDWTLPPLIRDSFSMIGSAVGCTTSAFYGFNHGSNLELCLDFSRNKDAFAKAPPVIVFSSACAGLTGGAVPALAQLASSSYHSAFSPPSLPSPTSQDDQIHKSRNSSPL
ncbi:hypothetical protein TEA_001066 [Camellia sinensis var. sinensis]|uniref:Uncharacterized protein n=1 Tax=Camellia sinensis var. sinensis TaxID=542762 RepID=A0A4S4EWQ4_CAMSN|nr:hypothetical protein TEA_001066 [Camellia sinensis var. sinensis]